MPSSVSASSRATVRCSSCSRWSVRRSVTALCAPSIRRRTSSSTSCWVSLDVSPAAPQQRPETLGGKHRDESDRVAHAPPADHLPGDHRELLDVALGSGGDRSIDDLLRDASRDRHLELRDQILERVGDLVVVRCRQRHPERHPAGDDQETFRTESVPGVSIPTSACPASW